MAFVHRDRGETPLPEIAGPVLARIDHPRVAPVRFTESRVQPVRVLRHQNQVAVVGHQAIGPDLHARRLAALSKEFLVTQIDVVLEERPLPAVAKTCPPTRPQCIFGSEAATRRRVGDAMGAAWNHHACYSCNGGALQEGRRIIN